jgi:hypothetical protein
LHFVFLLGKMSFNAERQKEIENMDMNDPDHLEFYRQQLLTKRDRNAEMFIKKLMTNAESEFKSSIASADVSQQERLQQAQQKLSDTSIILAHKYQPLIEKYVAQQEQVVLNNKFAVIKATPLSVQEMAKKYKVCFNTWVRSENDVSIKIADKSELGKIEVIDAFILTYFAIMTNRRMTGDNVHQLVVSGSSSCGKTLIFESPMLEIAHMLTTEKGVSRFNCDAKSTLLLHDVNLDILVRSDADKFKAIARAEPVPTKTFGNVQTVPAVFMFVTSNRNLLNHVFERPEKKGFRFNRVYRTDLKPTRYIHAKDILAVQNRFIEAFVRQRPTLPQDCLPKNENFERSHVIVGLFDDIINILSKYEKDDFKIQYLYLYAMSGLSKHVELLPPDEQELQKYILYQLFLKYQLDCQQLETCCNYMNFVPPQCELE